MQTNPVQICVLLCRCRTGSTALTRAISEHNHAHAAAEVLNGTQPHSYQKFMLELLTTEPEARESFLAAGPLFAFPRYIDQMVNEALAKKPDLQLFVFECKIENLFVLSNQWVAPALDFSALGFLNLAMNLSDKVMILRRRNLLERWCSDQAAQTTGIFHSDVGIQEPATIDGAAKIMTGDVQQIISGFQKEFEFDRNLIDYMSAAKNVVSMEYENVYRDNEFSPDFKQMFFEEFDINLENPKLTKVRSLSAQDMIGNYDEVISAIQASPIGSYIL